MEYMYKLLGLDWIKNSYGFEDSKRDWFIHTHRYQTSTEINHLFTQGKPISCVQSLNNESEFYIYFFTGAAGGWEEIGYITVKMIPGAHSQHMGLHYCSFEMVMEEDNSPTINNIRKDQLDSIQGVGALMLPFQNADNDIDDYNNMFTLVYMDWDVLLVQDGKASKGALIVDYTQAYIESLIEAMNQQD